MSNATSKLLTAEDYEAWAREHLDGPTFDFVAGGAGTEYTLEENTMAYRRYRMIPKVMRDVSSVSTAVDVFGTPMKAPIMVSPIGMQRLVHPEAETATARGVNASGLGMSVGTASTVTLEELAEVGGSNLWFQLYWRKDRAVTQDLVERAARAGYKAIVLTVDTAVVGRRLRDVRNQYQRPPEIKYANFAPYEDTSIKDTAGSAPTYYVANMMDQTLTWDDLAWLGSVSGLPVIVKGVLSQEDGDLAMAAGAAGVMVSNHGARQLDYVPGTLDVLQEVVEGVAGRGLVAIDGGVRRATDVFIALALGADVVSIGRPVIWALAQGGEEAVTRFLSGVVEDLQHTMTLMGARTIQEIDSTMLRRIAHLERMRPI